MFDVAEARRLLAELPQNDAFKALGEVTDWLNSINDTAGFRADTRTHIVMMLDETALRFHADLFRLLFGETHIETTNGQRLWRALHVFWKALAEAYVACVRGYRQAESKPAGLKEIMPVVCVRLLRSLAEQMKLELMCHLDIGQAVWDQLIGCYKFAESGGLAETMVFAYPRQALHISPQRELARVMMLYLSSPRTLAPGHIEISFRVAARLSGLFDFKDAPDPDLIFCIDLAAPGAPRRAESGLQSAPSMRFFGAARAAQKITEMIKQHEQGLLKQEQRFGSEFSLEDKIAVLKHLQKCWEDPSAA